MLSPQEIQTLADGAPLLGEHSEIIQELARRLLRREVDIEAIEWLKLDPRNGNYEDCQAWVELCDAAELVGADLNIRDVTGWRELDSEHIAYRIAVDEGEAVWIVTTDHDGAPDGHGSIATRVEVLRCA